MFPVYRFKSIKTLLKWSRIQYISSLANKGCFFHIDLNKKVCNIKLLGWNIEIFDYFIEIFAR